MDCTNKFQKTFRTSNDSSTRYLYKKLTTEAYLKLMLYAQVHETEELRDLSDALLDADFQKASGIEALVLPSFPVKIMKSILLS